MPEIIWKFLKFYRHQLFQEKKNSVWQENLPISPVNTNLTIKFMGLIEICLKDILFLA